MSRCKIYCAENMVVGRWYKILAYPLDVDDDITTLYNVTYSCDNPEVAYLLHDTVYIKRPGKFSITAIDMYNNSDIKNIIAINKPNVERVIYNIIPVDWDDLSNKITAIGDNAYINIIKNTYNFDLTETPIIIPDKTIIDFNNSEINITSSENTYHAFQFFNDYCGLKNATFNGINMGAGTSYSEQCTIVQVTSGKYHEIENLIFNNVAGFNITIGTWPSFWYCKPSYQSGRWLQENNFNGYINEYGDIVEDTNGWTMEETAESITTEDLSFCVGYSGMWLPVIARSYNIAFYDENRDFIELDKDLMFYRKYYYPENTKYFRLFVYQKEEPTDSNARDDICIMRMMGGTDGIDKFVTVEDLWMDNIICNNHASGGLSIVGVCQDVHINRLMAVGNGWKNGWAFDIEDSWNSSIGVVLSHCYFGNGTVIFMGTQGFSMISTISGQVGLRALIHAPNIINCICSSIAIERVRNNLTTINSYCGSITNQEQYDNVYTFNNISQEEAIYMRNKIDSLFD